MRTLTASLLAALLITGTAATARADPSEPPGTPGAPLSLSPDLLALFRAEMRELLVGTQTIAAALPTGAWDSIVMTSHEMKASYVLEKNLNPPLEKELAALPERFRDLDRNFHARTDKLAEAAMRRDAEAVTYQFSRLLESCVTCHSAFAQARFPTLVTPSPAEHAHQQ